MKKNNSNINNKKLGRKMINYLKKTFNRYGLTNIIGEGFIYSEIIILFDQIDFTSFFFKKKFLFFIICLLILYIVIKLLIKYIFDMRLVITNKNISENDKKVFAIFIAGICLCLYVFFTGMGVNNYKFFLITIVMLLSIVYIIIKLSVEEKDGNMKRKNIIDLQYLCTSSVEIENYNNQVFINDNEASYDLLNRDFIINALYNAIININLDENFTIGLNGKWGSGKTTIMNIVLNKIKEKNNVDFIIIKFDPWQYNGNEAMIRALLEQILCELDSFGFINNKSQLIDEMIEEIFDLKEEKLLIKFLKYITKGDEQNITSIVNNYLIKKGKKLLIIIDNLDRIDGNRVMILTKFLEYTLNFKRTVNVLLYDEEILKKAFENTFNFNGNYMEKIIQLKLHVPSVEKTNILKIEKKIINNLHYKNHKVLQLKCNVLDFDNIRELKIYFNSLIAMTLKSNDGLNINDKAMLLYIENGCPYLYNKIQSNKIFFTTGGQTIFLKDEQEKFLANMKMCFNNLEDELLNDNRNQKYLRCLEELFPNYKNYKLKKKIFDYNYYDDNENHIFDYRYFDLYFSYGDNQYSKMNKEISIVIKKINSGKVSSKFFNNLIKRMNANECESFFNDFYLKQKDINKRGYFNLVNCLIDVYFIIDNYLKLNFSSGVIKDRIVIIIADLLKKMNKRELSIILSNIKNNYKLLRLMYEIKIYTNEKNSLINVTYDDMCNAILDTNVDIYNDCNYFRKNLIELYKFNHERTIHYLKANLNCENILLFINDLVTEGSYGVRYEYSISYCKPILNKINEDNNITDEMIKKCQIPKNMSKVRAKLLKEVYNKRNITDVYNDKLII